MASQTHELPQPQPVTRKRPRLPEEAQEDEHNEPKQARVENSATMTTRNVATFVHLVSVAASIIPGAADLCFEEGRVTINELNAARTMCMCVRLDKSFFSEYTLVGPPHELRLDLGTFKGILVPLNKNQKLDALIMCTSDVTLKITAADGCKQPTKVEVPSLETDDGAKLSVPDQSPDACLEILVEDLLSITATLHETGYSKVLLKLVPSEKENEAPMLSFSGHKSAGGSENLSKLVKVNSAHVVAGTEQHVGGEFKVEALLLLFKGAKKLAATSVHLELNAGNKPLAIRVPLGVDEDDLTKRSTLLVHTMGLQHDADD